jgi:phospholipase/carboxylesterase
MVLKSFLSLLFSLILMVSSAQKPTLKYLVHQPKQKSAKPPLLVFLHGVGSNEEDLFSLADQMPGNFLVVSVRAPHTLAEGSYSWYDVDFSSGKPVFDAVQAEESRKQVAQFVKDLRSELTFEERQVYLCGFSQGGILSYSVGLSHPELIKGIAVMSGRLLEEVKPKIAAKEKLKSLRIFISHGTKDGTLGIEYARSATSFLKTLGLKPQAKEYPEGHTISKEMLADLVAWLRIM